MNKQVDWRGTDEGCHLLTPTSGQASIKVAHYEWFINQAILLAERSGMAESTRHLLEFLTLHRFSKVATISPDQADRLGLHTSPIYPQACGYHRCTKNDVIAQAEAGIKEQLGVTSSELFLIDNPLITEAFAREYPQSIREACLTTYQQFSSLLDRLLLEDAQDARLLIDISPLMEEASPTMVFQKLGAIAEAKISPCQAPLFHCLHLFGIKQHQGKCLLFIPHPFVKLRDAGAIGSHQSFVAEVSRLIGRTGYRVSPEAAKVAWLSVKKLEVILKELKLPRVVLNTNGKCVGEIFPNFEAFIQHRTVQAFKALSAHADAAPYLSLFPAATVALLEGFAVEGGAENTFAARGLTDLLQTSFFRMLNAMAEALLRKDDLVAFNNQVEVLHQEIQMLLALASPHRPGTFEESVIARLRTGPRAILPEGFENPQVHLKASAMQAFTSVLAATEAVKGTNQLNVALLKDSYYQEQGTLDGAKTYRCFLFDGDEMRCGREGMAKPGVPIDLFVTEFHHNLIPERTIYYPEDVLAQIKYLYQSDRAAEPLTVVIDHTIGLEHSQVLGELLSDPLVSRKIREGKLNLVLLRSAQKFDMLGMDNYYGGITIAINQGIAFRSFRQRMNHPDNQLRGLNYQGLTHIQKYAGHMVDQFRKLVVENTRCLYDQLPREMIFEEGSDNPLQISKMEDRELFFLDLKFPHYPETRTAFIRTLYRLALENRFPLTIRTSFPFMISSFTMMSGDKLRLNVGLDGVTTLNIFVTCFREIQRVMSAHSQSNRGEATSYPEMDRILAGHISRLSFE